MVAEISNERFLDLNFFHKPAAPHLLEYMYVVLTFIFAGKMLKMIFMDFLSGDGI